MSAYMIVQMEITDPTQYEKYKQAVPKVIEQYGGTYLVRGGDVEVLEGGHDGRRIVIFEFPSMERIREFFHSPEYAPVKKLREHSAILDVWAVPGCDAN